MGSRDPCVGAEARGCLGFCSPSLPYFLEAGSPAEPGAWGLYQLCWPASPQGPSPHSALPALQDYRLSRLSVWIAWSSCWHSKHRYPRGHLPDPYYMFSILVLESAISPKSPGSFLMESGLRTGHQVRSLLCLCPSF